MDGTVVRALASHQCVPGSIPRPSVICGLSLLLVLFSALRGFSPGTPVFPSPQKPTFPNSILIPESTGISVQVLVNSLVLRNKLLLHFFIYIVTCYHHYFPCDSTFLVLICVSLGGSRNQDSMYNICKNPQG